MKLNIQDGEGSADIRVCSNDRYHQDDLEGECSECHKPIFYRPDPPFLIKFVCLDCCIKMTGGIEKMEKIVMSSKTVKEIKEFMDGGNMP